jgi:hypothetical protein
MKIEKDLFGWSPQDWSSHPNELDLFDPTDFVASQTPPGLFSRHHCLIVDGPKLGSKKRINTGSNARLDRLSMFFQVRHIRI